MAENKTKPTDASVEDYILSRASEQQRTDCHELMALLESTRYGARLSSNVSNDQRRCVDRSRDRERGWSFRVGL